MAEKKPKIVFRRIKGRIVPIRVSGQKKKIKGSGQLVAGVVVAAAGGKIAAKATESFIFKSKSAESLMRLAQLKKQPSLSNLKFIAKALKKSKQLSVIGKLGQGLGILGGGVLISEGFKNLRDDREGIDAEIFSQLGAGAAAAAASIALKKNFGINPGSFKRVTELIKKTAK